MFQKNIYFCFIDYAKAFDYMDHHKLWKILKEMSLPDHLTCLFFFMVSFFFKFYFYFILLYNTVLVLPYIDMKPPQVYTSSQVRKQQLGLDMEQQSGSK